MNAIFLPSFTQPIGSNDFGPSTLERPLASAISNNRGLQAGCRKEQLKIAELKVAFEGERAKEMRIEGIRLAPFSLEGLHFPENIEARMNSLVRFVH